MTEPIHIISLGAGVQSSTVALMAASGEIVPMPHSAVFAHVGDENEPDSVYRQLDWLEKNLPFPIVRVSVGNLVEQIRGAKVNGNRCSNPPFFVWVDGEETMIRRKCTHDFKIVPLRRYARKLNKETDRPIVKWIGISLDEVYRMKESDVGYITHRHPLIELKMSRHDCVRWLEKRGFPKAPKSACWFCPYSSDTRWAEMKREDPKSWDRAVKLDKDIRNCLPNVLRGEAFIHRSCKPLSEVDFSTEEERGQLNMFNNDCSGTCGV